MTAKTTRWSHQHDGATFPRRPRLIQIGAQGHYCADHATDRGKQRRNARGLDQHATVCRGRADPRGFRRGRDFRNRRKHTNREDATGCASDQRTFHEGQHLLLQNFPATRQPLFHRVLCQIERVGHVLHRAMLAVVENQRFAIHMIACSPFWTARSATGASADANSPASSSVSA